MKHALVAAALASASVAALAVQETFTTAGPRDCSAVAYCLQNTGDNLFTLDYAPTRPMSGPSATGFNVRSNVVEIYNANHATLDMSIISLAITRSNVFNGTNYIGAIQLEVQDASANWTYLTQWSSYVGSPSGIYVTFNGHNPQSPLIKGVYGLRLTGVNGTTAFRIGMANLTAH
jgi:hypothetical protein